MVNIFIKTDSHYKVDRARIRKCVLSYLAEKKIKGDFEVSVNVVGERMMRELNARYRSIDKPTDVLAFPLMNDNREEIFAPAPDGLIRLGDIVLCYPKVVEEAGELNKMVDEVVDELVLHAMDHLFGNHDD